MRRKKANHQAHVFAGPLSPGEALILQYLSKCWKWYFESYNRPL